MKKRWISLALVLCMVLTLLPASAFAADIVDSGNCGAQGDNVTWTLDSDGVLTISGTGEMASYKYSEQQPWDQVRDSVKTVEIQNGVTVISTGAFFNCSHLTNVSIPNSVTKIGDGAFNSCVGLTDITIPSNVKSIGESAFYNCSTLKTLMISEGVESIGTHAFSVCNALEEVIIPSTVKTIGNGAFAGSNSLDLITVNPDNNYYCDIDGNLYSKDRNILFCCTATWNTFEVPEGVTTIGAEAFNAQKKIWEVTLPDTLLKIEDGAFANCSQLRTINNLYRVREIGQSAFNNCRFISTIELPNVVSIGAYAFYKCKNLINVMLSDQLTLVDDYAFSGCSSLENINMPTSVTQVGREVFSDTALKSDENNWENGMFYVNHILAGVRDNLSQYPIKAGTKVISDFVFWNCGGVESVTIPSSVTHIGEGAFYFCYGLLEINVDPDNDCYCINNGVLFDKDTKTIIYYPKAKADSAYSIPSDITQINSYAFYGASFSKVTIPNSVTIIGDYAFNSCHSLTSIAVPDSITCIGNHVFDYCTSLKSVTIPSSVTNIGDYAFYDCYNLKDVYYAGSEEQWRQIILGNYNDRLTKATIHFNSTGPDDPSPTPPSDPTGKPSFTVPSNSIHLTEQQEVVMVRATLDYSDADYLRTCLENIIVTTADTKMKVAEKIVVAEDGKSAELIYTLNPFAAKEAQYNFFWYPDDLAGETVFVYGLEAIIDDDSDPYSNLTEEERRELYINQHLAFIDGDEYSERLDNTWAFQIADGLNTPKSNVAEALYDVLNTGSELLSGEKLSVFDNPYDAILTDLILAQTETQITEYRLKYKIKLLEYIQDLEDLCEKADPNWALNGGEYKTLLEQLVSKPDSVNEDFYNLCKNTFGIAMSDGSLELLLNGYQKFGVGLKALNSYGEVVNWVSDCMKFNAVVDAYLETSNEFKQTLNEINHELYLMASSNDVTSLNICYNDFNDALGDLQQYQTNENIAKMLFAEYTKEGMFKVTKVFSGALIKNAAQFLQKRGVPGASWVYAVIEAYKTGWSISEDITQNGDIMDCKKMSRAYYYLESALLNVVKADENNLADNHSYANALKFDASYSALRAVECGAITNYIKQLDAQQSSMVQSAKNGELIAPWSSGQFNFAEISNMAVHKMMWEEALCHDVALDQKNRDYNSISPISVCCPTDVYVYNPMGNLECSVVGGTIWNASEDIIVNLIDEEKYLVIPDAETFNIEIKPTGSGAMDFSIASFQFENGEVIQSADYIAIPIKAGEEYKSITEEQITLIKTTEGGSVTEVTPDYRDVIDSGTCGENLTWTLDSNGLLTISGTGPMANYEEYYESPFYSNRHSIQSVIIEPGLTSIGGYAFAGCEKITELSIPDGVTAIKKYAMLGCSALTSVTIPESVTSIERSSFSYCRSLTSITIPNSVTSIGESVFDNCSSLTSVTIPDSVTSIGNDLFYGCSGLTEITIPDSVTSIGSGAFISCSSLTSVTIPDSVTSIGGSAFNNCSSVTSVTIPNSVTSIGGSAFNNCSSLTSVTIPDSVTSIGESVFRYCSSLTSVRIPNSVTSIGESAFNNCSSLTNVTIPNSVTSIGRAAFSYCSSLTSVTIPDSVTSIGDNAFNGCSSLTSVTIPDSVTSIGKWAFRSCSSLTSVTIPNSVTSIGERAFASCSNLTSVTIPNSVTSIESDAFYDCSSLTSVTIPGSVTSIGKTAFGSCDRLVKINVESNNNYYSSLDGVLFNKNKTTLLCCPGSKTVYEIPSSVTSLGYYAFYDCSSLTSVTIPDTVTSIGDHAFYSCTSLTSVKIPDNVTSIGDYAFAYCSSVTRVTIPDSVTSIENWAFRSCSNLMSVKIPDNVTSIGRGAFDDCSNLTDVYYNGTQEQWNRISIRSYNDPLLNATIHYIPKDNPFKDVPDGKFYTDAVLWAVSRDPQITTGVTDTTFMPDRTCTRAHVVTFLWRANGCPEPKSTTNTFKDVPNGKYYTKAVLWAAEQGITTGYSDGTFRPEDDCTRAQVVTFLWRANGSPNPTSTTNPFKDVSNSAYYAKAILWALETGVTTGKTATTFNPDGECTRAHVVTFLYRDMA